MIHAVYCKKYDDAFAKAIHLESMSTSQIFRRFREMSTDVAAIVHKSVVQTLGLELGFNTLRQSNSLEYNPKVLWYKDQPVGRCTSMFDRDILFCF